MNRKIALGVAALLVFSLGVVAGMPGIRSGHAQSTQATQDTRKKPGFDPTQFQGEDLTPLLKDKKFSDGKHLLTTFPDGSKLNIETKKGKIRRAFLVEKGGSQSEATIHSPTGTPTARSFTVGVHVKTPLGEKCWICTFGRDSQQDSGSGGGATTRARQRLIRCHSAPCDDFYPEPDPPRIDPLKKDR